MKRTWQSLFSVTEHRLHSNGAFSSFAKTETSRDHFHDTQNILQDYLPEKWPGIFNFSPSTIKFYVCLSNLHLTMV